MRTVLAATLAFALLTTSCASEGGDARAADTSTLDWADCGDLECAVLHVPLDHADPGGPTIGIDIARAQAGDADARIGVLLVNPGGPGGSGVSLASLLASSSPELAEVFDIIGWDPRGVGPSAELRCDQPLVDFYRLDNTPDDSMESAEFDIIASAAASTCAELHPDLLPHIGTAAVVEDMDLIRVALGEERINYLGFSYGTMLGLVYAARHGDKLRAAVLDGVLDPTFTLEEWLTSQAVATEAALDLILQECDACPEPGIAALTDVIAAAERGELTAGDTTVSPSDVTRAGVLATYDPQLHPRVRTAIEEAATGDGTAILDLSNTFLNLASFDVYTAVSCLDNERPTAASGYDTFVERITEVAPVLGEPIANELRPCASWSVDPAPPIESLSDTDAPPMLVLGNTGDSATPYADAVRVVEALDRAVLVTYVGEGHTSYQEGSQCVDDAVVAYLLDLTLPTADLVCR